jgi:hypothetical protein
MANVTTRRSKGASLTYDEVDDNFVNLNSELAIVYMPGEIKMFSGAEIPAHWMACEGQLLAVAEYPELFDAIGYTYGGDSMATFALPNYRWGGSGQRKIICAGAVSLQPVLQVTVPSTIHGPAAGYYKADDVLSLSVQMLDDITVSGGPVSLSLSIGGTIHALPFSSGSAREWLFPSYTVQSGDNGDITASINLNGATLSSHGVAAALSETSIVSGTVDTTAPTITFSELKFSVDSGSSGTDFVTSSAVQTITATLSGLISETEIVYGSLDNGATWLDLNNRLAGTSLLWDNVTLTGSNTLKLKVTDLSGNDGAVTSQAYVLDTIVATPTLTLATDSGTSSGDGITNVGTINVGGLEPGATWRKSTNGGTTWTAGTGSSFVLASGTYAAGSIKVEQTDIAGNISSLGTNSVAITVDTTAPAVPTADALSTSNTTPTITGTATVASGEELTVTVNGITYAAGAGDLILAGTTWELVIPPAHALAIGTYSVTATVTDLAGNYASDTTGSELVITG